MGERVVFKGVSKVGPIWAVQELYTRASLRDF